MDGPLAAAVIRGPWKGVATPRCSAPMSRHNPICIKVGESYWLEARLVLAVKCFLAASCLRLPGTAWHFSREQRKSTEIIS